MALVTEDQVELQSIEWFKDLGYQYKHGNDISPEGKEPERSDFRKVILEDRLRSALIKINSDISHYEGISLKADQDVWINVLEESMIEDYQVEWWLNEN